MNQNEPSGWRKKPVVIEAMRFTHESSDACREWIGPVFDGWQLAYEPHRPMLRIRTLDGVMEASEGDWIIRGGLGGFYPCKPDIFAATYEPAAAVPSAPVAPEPDGLRALSDAATAGPWEWVGDELVGAHDEADIEDYPDEDRREFVLAVQTFCGLPNPPPADAALIAAAVNYVRAALAAGVPSTPQAPDDRQGDCDEPRTEIHGFLGDYEVIHPSAATVPVVPEPLADRLGASVAIPVESLAEGAAIHAARTAPVVPEEPAADEILHPACLVPGGMCWPITGRCHNCCYPAPVADVEPQPDGAAVRPCGCGRPTWSEEAEEEFDAAGGQYDPNRWCPHWCIEDVRTDSLAPGDLYAVQGDIPLAVSWWEVAAVGEPDPDLCAVWYVDPDHADRWGRARTNHASPDHLFHVLRLGMVGRQTIAPASSAPDVLRMPAEPDAAWVIETALTEWASGQDEAADECSDESSRDELRRQATIARKFAEALVAAARSASGSTEP